MEIAPQSSNTNHRSKPKRSASSCKNGIQEKVLGLDSFAETF